MTDHHATPTRRMLVSAALLSTLASITLVAMAIVALTESRRDTAASLAVPAGIALALTLALALASRRNKSHAHHPR